MYKRPKPKETEEDILRMQEEFLAEKAKNPNFKTAAEVVKVPKKSLFKQNREKLNPPPPVTQTSTIETGIAGAKKPKLNEMIESTVGNPTLTNDAAAMASISEIVLGDIVERKVDAPKREAAPIDTTDSFPKVLKMKLNITPKAGKSIFAQAMEKNVFTAAENTTAPDTGKLNNLYGTTTVVVADATTAAAVHKENLELLSKMKEEEILAERKRLLESVDPALVAMLARKRQAKAIPMNIHEVVDMPMVTERSEELAPTNAAIPLIARSDAEKWLHFDVVEGDKLAWMQDVPMQAQNWKPGEKFEARFDWKGVLLPYNLNDETMQQSGTDERELYLHGDEPERPGYTLQELFRLARSNVSQQRISAFGAIAGILNIYNQGFYDQVLDLPISKIFFLLRFGFDDNSLAMLEVVSKAMSYLFYNEADETLLDFIYDNPGCHWQPTLQVISAASEQTDDDPMSINNLQKQIRQLKMSHGSTKQFHADIVEPEEETKTTMSDFQLAETDLIDCLLRTNILQRINFILEDVRPDNSTVTSCLKLLIRLARAGKDVAMQIVAKDELIDCLMEHFLPGLELVDTTQTNPVFYKYPQHLCLKLIRILCSANLGIALKFVKLHLIEKLQNYLYTSENLKGNLITVQIEALRLLRCLLLLRVDNMLYKKFVSAFRYMLEWHYNHVIYEVGGPYLIRQHAAALLSTIASIANDGVCLEISTALGDALHNCLCSWFHKATKDVIKEFSQLTLLSACISVVTWLTRHGELERLQMFNQRYLPDFIRSPSFEHLVANLSNTGIILKSSLDRRYVHAPLPNCGSILMHKCGPQLIITQNYGVFFLNALWRLLDLQLQRGQKLVFDVLLQPNILEHLVLYLRQLSNLNTEFLAPNFFAKNELQFVFKLLCFPGLSIYFSRTEMLQLCYNFLCCLTAEHIEEIETLLSKFIFNVDYLQQVDAATLALWCNQCMECMVLPHAIVVAPTELSLTLPATRAPLLPRDWPYYNLRDILQNYIENLNQQQALEISEHAVLQMTFEFVAALEENANMAIGTPTEQLMYLMIAFMGPESQFLTPDIHALLKQHIQRFYAKNSTHTFQFDAVFEGKCKFENLYALFVDHFQAASYGDELFSSLVLVPLAQKYDNKWRRRLWSEYAAALRFLDCPESLLLGGLDAYLWPAETDKSLIKTYAMALNTNSVRPGSIPYRIAKHHLTEYQKLKPANQ